MSVVLKVIEYIFLLWVLIKTNAYSLWCFKNKSIGGGMLLMGLNLLVAALFVFTAITGA